MTVVWYTFKKTFKRAFIEWYILMFFMLLSACQLYSKIFVFVDLAQLKVTSEKNAG